MVVVKLQANSTRYVSEHVLRVIVGTKVPPPGRLGTYVVGGSKAKGAGAKGGTGEGLLGLDLGLHKGLVRFDQFSSTAVLGLGFQGQKGWVRMWQGSKARGAGAGQGAWGQRWD